MKTKNYSVLSAISSIVVGIILIMWPDAATAYLVITIGAFFFIPGLYSVIMYFVREEPRGSFPVSGAGSALLGLWLMVTPKLFVDLLMYLLGAVLVFAALGTIVRYQRLSRNIRIPAWNYILPVLVLAVGITVLAVPFEAASVPFFLLGLSSCVYGMEEINTILKTRKADKAVRAEEVEAETVADDGEASDVALIEEGKEGEQ